MNCNGFSTSSLTAIKKTWNQAAGVVVQISLTIHLVTNVPEVVDTYFMNSSSWQASSFCDHPSSSNESIFDVIMISNGIVLLVLVGHHLWKWFLLPPCMVACTHIKCQYPFYSITLLFYRLFETKKKKKTILSPLRPSSATDLTNIPGTIFISPIGLQKGWISSLLKETFQFNYYQLYWYHPSDVLVWWVNTEYFGTNLLDNSDTS